MSKIFSFFSGAGFLDLGFEQHFEVAFVNEWHQPFLDAYIYSRKKLGYQPPEFGYSSVSVDEFLGAHSEVLTRNMANLRSYNSEIGFIGGPPCPDFSVGGKNKGEKGENGRLTRTYCEIIIDQKPDWFLLENVKGLWRTKKHREFYEEMKDGLSGDFHLHERLTNSIEAGVPQDRDRIFLFGRNKNSYSDTTVDWEKNFAFPGRSAFEFNWAKTDDFKIDGKLRPNEHVPKELSVSHWFDRNNVESHPNAEDFFQPRAGLAKFLVVKEGDVSRKSYKRLHRHRYSPTAAYGNNEVHLHPFKARRLSVAEALAIQSMPSAFSLPPCMTLSNKFKTIGNGVPYLLSAAVAKTISESLSQSRIKEFD